MNTRARKTIWAVAIATMTMLCLAQEDAHAGWYNSSWPYRVKITVQNGKVDADLTNFPVYVNLANLPAGFHTNVNQTDARDIRVTKSDGTTELAREVVFYNSSTDTGELHFLADSLSNISDTDFYIYYGNASASDYAVTATYGRNAVWSNGYKAVSHFGNGTTTNYTDATGNGNNGTGENTPAAVGGKLGGAASFVDTSSQRVSFGAGSSINLTTNFTVQAWALKTTSFGAPQQGIVSRGYDQHLIIRAEGAVNNGYDGFTFRIRQTVNAEGIQAENKSIDTWYHLVMVVGSRGAHGLLGYVDGVAQVDADTTGVGDLTSATNVWYVGYNDRSYQYLAGYVDELRISNVVRTATWLSTEYSNQNTPTTFYNVAGVENFSVGWYNASWPYRVKITVQNGKVDADLTNFPVYVNLANLPAGFHANVNQTDARDIRVTKFDGVTEVAREVVSYVAAWDTGELHFLADALSNASDTNFYIYYGNAAATEPAANSTYGKNSVWSDYTAVLHMTAAGNATQPDSTVNVNNFTPTNLESGDRVAGKLTYALNFDGVDEYLTKSSALFSSPPFTLSAWGRTSSYSGRRLISVGDADAWAAEHGIGTYYSVDTRKTAASSRDASNSIYIDSTIAYDLVDFFLVHGVFSATNNRTIYYNAGNSATNTTTVTPTGLDKTCIGNIATMNTSYWTGSISEVRIRPSALTSTWISTEYNNQNSPSTFYNVGQEGTEGPGVQGGRLWSNGFERGWLADDWPEKGEFDYYYGDGLYTLDTNLKRSGSYSWKFTATAGIGYYATLTKMLFDSATLDVDIYARAYINISTLPNALTDIMRFASSGSNRGARIRLATNGTLELWDSGAKIGNSSSALNTGQWYRIELRNYWLTGSSNDTMEAKLDGASFASTTTGNSSSAGMLNFVIGLGSPFSGSGEDNVTGVINFDDIAINNTSGSVQNSWPGEGRIACLFPNAAGDNNGASSGDYTSVNEPYPDNGLTFAVLNDNNDILDVNVQNTIATNVSSITLVQVGIREAAAVSGAESWILRLKSQASGTVLEGPTTSHDDTVYTDYGDYQPEYHSRFYPLTCYVNPQTSSAWTTSLLDSMQIGVQAVDADPDINVTQLWVLVEYVGTSLAGEAQTSARLWSDGFERIYGSVAGGGFDAEEPWQSAYAMDSTIKRSGSYSLNFKSSSAAQYLAKFIFDYNTDLADRYFRAYINITALPTAITDILGTMDSSGNRGARIRLTTNGTLELWDSNSKIGSSSSVLSTGQWYRVELHHVWNGTGSAMEIMEARLDGTIFAVTASGSCSTNGMYKFNIGIVDAATAEINFDDIAVSENNWPGEGHIINLFPNAAGDNNGASSGDYRAVDETTPDDSFTLAVLNDNNDILDVNVQNIIDDSVQSVTLVQVGIRGAAANTTGYESWKLRIKSQASGTVLEGVTTNHNEDSYVDNGDQTVPPELYTLTSYTDPQTGGAWTTSLLNTMQIGVQAVDADPDINVTQLWALVEYVGGTLAVENFPERMWSEGYENQARVLADGGDYDNGGLTAASDIDTTLKRSGSASFKYKVVDGTNAYLGKYMYGNSSREPTWARAYINITTMPSSATVIMGRHSSSAIRWITIKLNTNGTLGLYMNDEATQIGSNSSALSTGVWYRIEMFMMARSNQGQVEARIDGVSFASSNHVTGLGGDVSQFFVGSFNWGPNIEINFDDLAINNSTGCYQNGWPGEGKIVHLLPNAAGDNNNALSGDYTSIDEIMPDNGTTKAVLNDNNDILDVNVQSASDVGINFYDTIKLVAIGIDEAAAVAGNEYWKLRLKSQSIGTVFEGIQTRQTNITYTVNGSDNPGLYSLTSYVDPQAGGVWTPALLDTMQIGVQAIDADPDINVTKLWALVEYNEGVPPPTNDSMDILNHSDDGILYAAQEYTWQVKVTEAQGVAKLQKVDLKLDGAAGYPVVATWTEASDSFAITTGSGYATISSTGADSTVSGNQVTLNFKITLNWIYPNQNNGDDRVVSTLDTLLTDTDDYTTDTWRLEKDLTVTSVTCNDNTRNPDVTDISVTGYLDYEGTTTPEPPTNCADIRIDPSWTVTNYDDTDLTSAGYFSVASIAGPSSVGAYTYDVDVISPPSGAGTVSSDNNSITIDRVKITGITFSGGTPSGGILISGRYWFKSDTNVNINVAAALDYGGSAITAGRVSVGHSGNASYFGNSGDFSAGTAVKIRLENCPGATVTYDGITVGSVTLEGGNNTYGTAVNINSQNTKNIGWDGISPTAGTVFWKQLRDANPSWNGSTPYPKLNVISDDLVHSYVYIDGYTLYFQRLGSTNVNLVVEGASDNLGSVEYDFPDIFGSNPAKQSSAASPVYNISSVDSGSTNVPVVVYDPVTNTTNTNNISIEEILSQPAPTAVLCKTGPGGADISAQTWQNDNTPFAYWTPPVAACGIASYDYKVNNADSEVEQIAATSTGANAYVELVLPDGKWRIRTRALNNVGMLSNWTDSSNWFDVWVDATAPVAGSMSYGTITSSSIAVSVSGASDATSGLPANYCYFEYDAGATTFATADGNSGWCAGSWTPSGLTANTVYAFRYKLKDNAGNETAWQTPTPAYKYTLPPVPTIDSCVAQSDQPLNSELGKIIINWSSSPAATAYTLERDTDSNFGSATTVVNNQAVTTYTDTGLSDNVKYYYRAKGRNPDNTWSSYSTSASATTPDRTKPATPSLGVAESNCVGYWSFDDTNAVGRDYSMYGKNGTNSGATFTASGVSAGCLSFDGNDYLTMPAGEYNTFGTSSFSISTWLKTSVAGGQSCIASIAGGGLGFRFGYSGGYPYALYGDGTNYWEGGLGTTRLDDGKWHHLVILFVHGSELRAYLDGAYVGSQSVSTITGSASTGSSLWIGTMSGSGGFVNGLVDEVRIYNRVLTVAEINAQYSGGIGYVGLSARPGDSNLVGCWEFDEGSGTYAYDASGNGNTGAITNGTFNDGKFDKSLSFNGNGDVNINNADNFNFLTLTYTFWFKSTADPYPNLIGRQFADTTGWTVHFTGSAGNPILAIRIDTVGNGNQLKSISGTVNDGAWHFGAVVLNDTAKTVKIYLDGTEGSEQSYAGNFTASGGFLKIAGPAVGAGYYTGDLDDIRIYNTTLTSEQVRDIYSSGANRYAYYRAPSSSGTYELANYHDSVGIRSSLRMDDGSGTTVSDSIASYDGSFLGAPEWTGGIFGGALKFDGVDDRVTFTNWGPQNHTMSMWIKTSANVQQGIESQYSDHGYWNHRTYMNANGTLTYELGNDNVWSNSVTTTAAINDGAWHYISVTYDTVNMKIYIDGVEKASQPENRTTGTGGGLSYYIGTNSYTNGVVTYAVANTFNGLIDEVKTYNRALSAAEIRADMMIYDSNIDYTDTFAGFADSFEGGVQGASLTTLGWTINAVSGFEATIDNGTAKLKHNPVDYNGAYVKHTIPSTSKAIIEFDAYISASADGWSLQVFTDNGLYFCNDGGGSWQEYIAPWEAIGSASEGAWHHYKLIMDCPNHMVYYYIDGVYQTFKDDAITTSNLTEITFGDYGLMSGVIYNYIDNLVITPLGTDKGDSQAPAVPAFYATDAADGSSSHNTSAWQSGISNDNTIDFGWTEPLSNGDDYFYYTKAIDTLGNESNLISNRGFEKDFTNWRVDGTPTNTRDTTYKYEGEYSAKLSGGNKTGRIIYDFPVTLKGTWIYSVYVYNPNEAISASGQLYYDGAYHDGFALSQNTGFTKYTLVFSTTTASQTIEFHLWNNTTGIYYDNVELHKVTQDTATAPIAGYWWAVNDSTPESGGTWVPRTTVSTATPALSDGIGNYIYVKAEDGAGNISSVKTYGPFYIDATAPVPGTLQYSNITHNSMTVTISGASDATSGIVTNGYYIEYDANATTFTASDASTWCNGTWNISGINPNKPYAFRWKVKDNAGNETAAQTASPAYRYTLPSPINLPTDPACDRSTSTWYQGLISTEKFNFTSSNLTSGNTQYLRYIWDRSPSTAVTSGDTQWLSGTLQLTPANSKNMYLHIIPYNAANEPNTQGNFGPFYFVDTSRLLKHKKFFDDDGVLQSMN